MNHSLYTYISSILFSLMLPTMAMSQTGSHGKLVWSDEFNVDGKLSDRCWNYENGFVRNHEDQWYQSDNAYCKDGLLIIEARKDSFPNPRFNPVSRRWDENRPKINYTSSSVNTKGKFEFTFGTVEVKARIPVFSGAWPAIWTLGTTMQWPSCGEIDVMEFYRINDVPHILANAAWGTNELYKAQWNSRKVPFSQFLEKDSEWASKFHVWKMIWDDVAIKIFLDEELINEIPLSSTVNGSLGQYANPMKQPHYLLLNLALGGDNGGAIDESAFPMRYEIDYVRIYQ